MRKKITAAVFALLSTCSFLTGQIIETAHFAEIAQHITPDTLVILDIDDTLLIPVQTLGTDAWFTYQLEKNKDLDKTLGEWEAVRHLTQMKIVEEGTDLVIQSLQQNNIRIMGLTTQGLALTSRTIIQLLSVNIDLSLTAPSSKEYYFMNRLGVLFRHGILFTTGTHKGKALLHLLELMDYHPSHIVFINDKGTHLKQVEESVEASGISFTGLRYSYSDERVANFRPEIAEVQWRSSSFERILTDEEAEELLVEGGVR